MKILLDNGHGKNSINRSPDGRLIEGDFARKVVKEVYNRLISNGLDAIILVPEDEDIPLRERVNRANKYYDEDKDTILISIHADASPKEGWQDASGFSVWVSKNASDKSKELAGCVYDAVEATSELRDEVKNIGKYRLRHGASWSLRLRQYTPNQKYWQANYYILKNTKCPAILTENGFQTNKNDVDYMLSDTGFNDICSYIVDGTLKYIQKAHLEAL